MAPVAHSGYRITGSGATARLSGPRLTNSPLAVEAPGLDRTSKSRSRESESAEQKPGASVSTATHLSAT